MRALAPRRTQSLFLLRAVEQSHVNKNVLCRAAGWPDYPSYYVDLRSRIIVATPIRVERLMKLADILEFPRDQIFLDEPLTPRAATRADVASNGAAAR